MKAFPIISSEAYNPCFCFIDVKDYNVKPMWSLCAKWNYSQNTLIVCVKVFRFFIHLIVWRDRSWGQIAKEYKFKETKEQRYHTKKGKNFPLNGSFFSKNYEFPKLHADLFIILYCFYEMECHTACIDKGYVVVTYSV